MILSIMMPLWAAAAETEEEAVQTQETVAQDLPEEAAEETDPAQDLSEEESPVQTLPEEDAPEVPEENPEEEDSASGVALWGHFAAGTCEVYRRVP